MIKPTAHDIDVLARTIDGEAGGEGDVGETAVGFVILKRAQLAAAYAAKQKQAHPQYGDGSIAGACLKTGTNHAGHTVWQFDCWAAGDPNLPRIKAATLNDPGFQHCYLAALSVILGNIPDPTDGATHYWAENIPTPVWAVGMPAKKIGRQFFVTLR